MYGSYAGSGLALSALWGLWPGVPALDLHPRAAGHDAPPQFPNPSTSVPPQPDHNDEKLHWDLLTCVPPPSTKPSIPTARCMSEWERVRNVTYLETRSLLAIADRR